MALLSIAKLDYQSFQGPASDFGLGDVAFKFPFM